MAAAQADARMTACASPPARPLSSSVSAQRQRIVSASPVWKSNLQPEFNVSVCDRSDARLSAVLRELDESNRFVQKSAESTSI
jgi:hypothetical protein